MECTSGDANCVLSVPPGVLTVCYPHPLGVLIKPTFRECMQFPKDQYHIFARSVIIFLLLWSKVYSCEYRCKSLRSQSLCCAPLMTITFSRGSKMVPNGQIRLSRFTITRSKCALWSQEHCSAVGLRCRRVPWYIEQAFTVSQETWWPISTSKTSASV